MSYDEDQINSVPLDATRGEVVYKGQTLTLAELLRVWEEEDFARQDRIADLRDTSSDTQALWGNKKNRFYDNWYHGRKKQLRQRPGYPKDIGE